MRKTLCFILAFVLLFSAVACGKGEAPNNGSSPEQNTAQGFAGEIIYSTQKGEPNTLDNTYYKLTTEKKLNVAYLGGSVTAGTGSTTDGCWRAYTTKWLKDAYPEAEINEIFAAIGGTGSVWGLARLQKDVLDKKPDLVFVEFSLNDHYDSLTYNETATYIEGIIRAIRQANPNADIIMPLIVDQGTLEAGYSQTQKAHIAVAEYYGIQTVDFRRAIMAEMEKSGNGWKYYITDWVHPNSKGYRVYADYMIEAINTELSQSAAGVAALNNHSIPENTYISGAPTGVTTVMAADISCDSQMWKERSELKNGMKTGKTLRGEAGSEMTLEIEGTAFAVVGQFWEGSNVEFTVDGLEDKKVVLGKTEKTGAIPVFLNLNAGKHTVKIKCIGKTCSIGAVVYG